jgi:hypothetical protein
MNSVKDYIKYFKDVPFSESPFNDVDNLLLATIIYVDFENIVTKAITLKDAGTKFFNNIDYKKIRGDILAVRKAIENFELLFNGKRYKDIILSDYVKIVDNEKQFCAITYHLPDGSLYIAYEGTDESVVGWKEDLQMFYEYPVPSQKMAINYINKIVKFHHKKIMVGGHSKGGNLAIVAAMGAYPFIKKHIIKIYNNDGPGLRKKQIETKEYQEILPKIKTFIPAESIVGLMLRNPENAIIIKSSSRGVLQHNAASWECYGPIFLTTTLSQNSINFKNWITNWLDEHNDEERKRIILALFEVLEKNEITKITEFRKLNFTKIINLIKTSHELDKDSKDLVLNILKMLIIGDNDI